MHLSALATCIALNPELQYPITTTLPSFAPATPSSSNGVSIVSVAVGAYSHGVLGGI